MAWSREVLSAEFTEIPMLSKEQKNLGKDFKEWLLSSCQHYIKFETRGHPENIL
jgi:hypothetical protein